MVTQGGSDRRSETFPWYFGNKIMDRTGVVLCAVILCWLRELINGY